MNPDTGRLYPSWHAEQAKTWPDAGPAIIDCAECGSSTYAETWRDIVPREVPL